MGFCSNPCSLLRLPVCFVSDPDSCVCVGFLDLLSVKEPCWRRGRSCDRRSNEWMLFRDAICPRSTGNQPCYLIQYVTGRPSIRALTSSSSLYMTVATSRIYAAGNEPWGAEAIDDGNYSAGSAGWQCSYGTGPYRHHSAGTLVLTTEWEITLLFIIMCVHVLCVFMYMYAYLYVYLYVCTLFWIGVGIIVRSL